MLDRFQHQAQGSDGPAITAFTVAPSDGDDLSEVTRAIYVGGDGDLVVQMLAGGQVTFANVPQGTLLPLRVRRIMAATTATNIVGLA